MAIVHTRSTVMGELMKVLGLPDHVTRFTVRAEVGGVVEVDVTYFLDDAAMEPTTESFYLCVKDD